MIKEIIYTETYQLRHIVMNPEKKIDDMYRPGDEKGRHYGYFDYTGLVGVISFYPETETGEFSQTEWRIRGMSVNQSFQGRGVGKQLFDYGVKLISPKKIWLNSRKESVGFYEKLGFQIIRETILTFPNPGKRYQMEKRFNYSE